MPENVRQVSHIEAARRESETRNEGLINRVRISLLSFGLLFHLSNLIWEWAHFRSSWILVAVSAAGILGCLRLRTYLSRDPEYSPSRKYWLSLIELVMVAGAFSFLGSRLPPSAAVLVPQSLYLVCIACAGLRFDRHVIGLVGALALLFQEIQVVRFSEPEMRIGSAFIALVVISTTTFAVSRMVEDLLSLHRESVIKSMLQRFLAPELVAEVSTDPNLLSGEVRRTTATVLFTDIRGFTTLSEHLPPEQVVRVLNRFLTEMTAAVMDHGGMLDKYIGDALMAVFGVPRETPDHADRALQAALDMRRRIERLNAEVEAEGLPTLGYGVGLHSGPLVVGAIGPSQRQDYTVIGDTVNVASRIESLTRKLGTDILISSGTRALLSREYNLAQAGEESVKGREGAVIVYRVD